MVSLGAILQLRYAASNPPLLSLWYKKVYLPLYKVADKAFIIQEEENPESLFIIPLKYKIVWL